MIVKTVHRQTRRITLAAALALPLIAATPAMAQAPVDPAERAVGLPEGPERNPFEAMARMLGPEADTMDADEMAAAIADRVPGFAGLMARPDGNLRAMFTRKSQLFDRGRALDWRTMRSPAADMLRSIEGVTDTARAQFDARQLLTFKRRAASLFSAGNLVFVDIDEQANRIRVGVSRDLDDDEMETLQQRMVAAGIPASALQMEYADKNVAYQQVNRSIRAQQPPLAGGSQIQFFVNQQGSGGSCSVGLPAFRNGVQGFITASHCTIDVYRPPGTTDNLNRTAFRAPTLSSQVVGRESIDPTGPSCRAQFPQGGTSADRCRRADAAFVAAAIGNAVQLGRIAFARSSDLVVTGGYNVVGAIDQPGVGTRLLKTGRTTGTTSGSVTRTCVTAFVGGGAPDEDYTVLCATETNVRASPGDSGGTYFTASGSSANFVGVLSYGNSAGTTGISPWGEIRRELGGSWRFN
jgi:hypothetical protein